MLGSRGQNAARGGGNDVALMLRRADDRRDDGQSEHK